MWSADWDAQVGHVAVQAMKLLVSDLTRTRGPTFLV